MIKIFLYAEDLKKTNSEYVKNLSKKRRGESFDFRSTGKIFCHLHHHQHLIISLKDGKFEDVTKKANILRLTENILWFREICVAAKTQARDIHRPTYRIFYSV